VTYDFLEVSIRFRRRHLGDVDIIQSLLKARGFHAHQAWVGESIEQQEDDQIACEDLWFDVVDGEVILAGGRRYFLSRANNPHRREQVPCVSDACKQEGPCLSTIEVSYTVEHMSVGH
jgi:hypothetical protein